MTEPTTATKATTKATTKTAAKAKIDFNKPYGYVVGYYEQCPEARLSQDGKFFNLRGTQVGEVPKQIME